MVNFNISTDAPTLTYPNGGEIFTSGPIAITWIEPSNISSSTDIVWYEIYITDFYDKEDVPNWVQIATIPSGISIYSYSIHENLKGEKCRIGIRAVDHRGQRSKISFSADNFTITNKRLPLPSVFSPLPNETYFSYIPFVFDHSAIMGRCSSRSFYQVSYNSKEQDIDWTLLYGNIMVGSDPIDIDVKNVPTSSDYKFKVELVDGDNVSEPVFIEDVTINNINYFLIDTIPPKGSIKIQNNNEYSKEKNIIVSLEAYDEITGVEEFRVEETSISSVTGEHTDVKGTYGSMTNLATWYIDTDDGVKLIQARYKDYGGNTITDDSNNKFFRTYKSLENEEITAFLDDGTDLYIAFAGDGNISGNNPQLYKNLNLMSTLSGEATALEKFNGILYIAIKDIENKGVLQRYVGSSIEIVRDNAVQYVDELETTLNSLYNADSVVNAMEVFDNHLFLGLENGKLLSFSGSVVTVENSDYSDVKSIRGLKTDGNILYIYFYNSIDVLLMYKDSSSNYYFVTNDIGN